MVKHIMATKRIRDKENKIENTKEKISKEEDEKRIKKLKDLGLIK